MLCNYLQFVLNYVQLNYSAPRDAIHPYFTGKMQVLWVLKTCVLVPRSRIRDAKYTVVF
jgi:hypothetical protein